MWIDNLKGRRRVEIEVVIFCFQDIGGFREEYLFSFIWVKLLGVMWQKILEERLFKLSFKE